MLRVGCVEGDYTYMLERRLSPQAVTHVRRQRIGVTLLVSRVIVLLVCTFDAPAWQAYRLMDTSY
jgi:hypothetical protein